MKRAYFAWRTFQERCLQYLAAVFLLVPALLTMLEVVRRYAFGQSFAWQQDAVVYGILTGVFLFFGITQSRNLHLRVTLVRDLARAGAGRWGRFVSNGFDLLASAAGLVFCAVMVWRAYPLAERMVLTGRMADSQIVPLWPFFIVFLLGMALMAVSFVFQVYERLQILRGHDPGQPPFGDGDGAEPIL